MCRSIQTLYNIEPPPTETEIRAAALQFVRKVSGYRTPSHLNAAAFEQAVDEITLATGRLLDALQTGAPRRDRLVELEKARFRDANRIS